MPISLGIWEWGCSKRRDAHITLTPGASFLSLVSARFSQQFLRSLLITAPIMALDYSFMAGERKSGRSGRVQYLLAVFSLVGGTGTSLSPSLNTLRFVRPVIRVVSHEISRAPCNGLAGGGSTYPMLIQPLTLLCTICLRKRCPFRIPSIDKWYHFHIHCLELCIPFNCCKCTVF